MSKIYLSHTEKQRVLSWLSNIKQITLIPNNVIPIQMTKVYCKHIDIVKLILIDPLASIISEYIQDIINIDMILYTCSNGDIISQNDESDECIDFHVKCLIHDSYIGKYAYNIIIDHKLKFNKMTNEIEYRLDFMEDYDTICIYVDKYNTNQITERLQNTVNDNEIPIDLHVNPNGYESYADVLKQRKSLNTKLEGDYDYCCEDIYYDLLVLCNKFMRVHYKKVNYIPVTNSDTKCSYNVVRPYHVYHLCNIIKSVCYVRNKIKMKNMIVITHIITKLITKQMKLTLMNTDLFNKFKQRVMGEY